MTKHRGRSRASHEAEALRVVVPGHLGRLRGVLCPDLASDLDLARAVAGLKQAHRVVVVLRFERDCTVAQIAGILGVAEGTVKSRLSRALDLLAGELAATEPEEEQR